MRQSMIFCALCVLASACAQRPENVLPRYVSPAAYRPWTCDQLAEERGRVLGEVQRVSGVQRENANADAAMVVGGLFLWPVLFGLAATNDRRDELGRLKGQLDAVEGAQRENACVART